MTLCNKEDRAVRLTPMTTDLINSAGHRLSRYLIDFAPREAHLEPGVSTDVQGHLVIPVETAPGCYAGLLVVAGVDVFARADHHRSRVASSGVVRLTSEDTRPVLTSVFSRRADPPAKPRLRNSRRHLPDACPPPSDATLDDQLRLRWYRHRARHGARESVPARRVRRLPRLHRDVFHTGLSPAFWRSRARAPPEPADARLKRLAAPRRESSRPGAEDRPAGTPGVPSPSRRARRRRKRYPRVDRLGHRATAREPCKVPSQRDETLSRQRPCSPASGRNLASPKSRIFS